MSIQRPMRLCLDMAKYEIAKTFEEFEKHYDKDKRDYPEDAPRFSRDEDFEKGYIWWLGLVATRLKDHHHVNLDKLLTLMREGLDEQGKTTMYDFFLTCFRQNEQAEHCADRIVQRTLKIIADATLKVDGQVREKGIGNA